MTALAGFYPATINFDITNNVMSMKTTKAPFQSLELPIPINGRFYDLPTLGWDDPTLLREFSSQRNGFDVIHEQEGYVALKSYKNEVAVIKSDGFRDLPFCVSHHTGKVIVGTELPEDDNEVVYLLLEALSRSYNTVTKRNLEEVISKLKLDKYSDYIVTTYSRSLY